MTYDKITPEFKNFIKAIWDYANTDITGKKVEYANATHHALHFALDQAGLPKGDERANFLNSL